MTRTPYGQHPPNDGGSDGGLAVIQAFVWILTFFFMLFSMFQLIEPEAVGFAINCKRLIAAAAISVAGYGVSRLAIVRGAPLAAAGSGAALAASVATFILLTPTIVVLTFLALSAPEIRKLDALEKCQLIRAAASQLDHVVLARSGIERLVKTVRSDMQTRAQGEAAKGRETGKVSVKGRPQPVTTLYQDAARYAGLGEEQLARGATDRTSAVRDVATFAEDCDRVVGDARKWAKEGPSGVASVFDRAGARLRELAQSAPLASVRTLIDQLRELGALAGETENPALDEARRVVRGHAERLEREVSRLPRMPDGLPPMAATPVLVAAFEASKFAATWHNLLIAFLVEGGSPLLWVYAFVRSQRRHRVETSVDREDDGFSHTPNGRARP